MDNDNVYLKEVRASLGRLLALFDTDPASPTHGYGDRYFWAWKLIDFANGTFQGAAHGLARLFVADLLSKELDGAAILERIDAMFGGADRMRRRNGSLEEAFPHENSFCVTSLVAYDLLSAVELLQARISPNRRQRYLAIVEPMVSFLHRSDEGHAVIANHLATAAAALFKWDALAGGGGRRRGEELLGRLLAGQSSEGWFREYEGADPGYQSLCTYYLADLHRLSPDLELRDSLAQSIRFLWYFAHPDGSFGGLYGSRNTRFYFPAGIEYLAADVQEAAVLARFMRTSIAERRVVTLAMLDEPNLIPMFNAYCWAAAVVAERGKVRARAGEPHLPALSGTKWQRTYPEAGLLVDSGRRHYTVISWHKGGVVYHFRDSARCRVDAGRVGRQGRHWYSTQGYRPGNAMRLDSRQVVVEAPLTRMPRRLPTPLQFLALRLLSLTVMRSLRLGNLVKKLLVRLLITGGTAATGMNRRIVKFGPDLDIRDEWAVAPRPSFQEVAVSCPFTAIHMASHGYWQVGDDWRDESRQSGPTLEACKSGGCEKGTPESNILLDRNASDGP